MTDDRHAERPDARQLTNLRLQLHDIVDRAIDEWPTIERQSREMVRGVTTGAGIGVGGGGGDPTFAVASGPAQADASADSRRWLNLFREFVVRGLELEAKRIKLAPTRSVRTGEPDGVEVCPECGRGVCKAGKRLDNALHHNGVDGDPPCWSRAYYRTHRADANTRGRAS